MHCEQSIRLARHRQLLPRRLLLMSVERASLSCRSHGRAKIQTTEDQHSTKSLRSLLLDYRARCFHIFLRFKYNNKSKVKDSPLKKFLLDTRNRRPQIIQEISTKNYRDLVEKVDVLLGDMEERTCWYIFILWHICFSIRHPELYSCFNYRYFPTVACFLTMIFITSLLAFFTINFITSSFVF